MEVFASATAIAVASIPEGMAVAVTVILALGMKETVKKNALTRKLLAAETLGSVDVICSDKTGTLTEGVMRLEKIISVQNDYTLSTLSSDKKDYQLADFIKTFQAGILCNNAILGKEGNKDVGSALEIGLPKAATNFQIIHQNIKKFFSVDEIPFNSR
jgi:Ca2+-transporting ATPase